MSQVKPCSSTTEAASPPLFSALSNNSQSAAVDRPSRANSSRRQAAPKPQGPLPMIAVHTRRTDGEEEEEEGAAEAAEAATSGAAAVAAAMAGEGWGGKRALPLRECWRLCAPVAWQQHAHT